MENKTEAAFEAYCRDPVVAQALEMARSEKFTINLLKDCFMAGAQYATKRCAAEHHH